MLVEARFDQAMGLVEARFDQAMGLVEARFVLVTWSQITSSSSTQSLTQPAVATQISKLSVTSEEIYRGGSSAISSHQNTRVPT